MRKTRRYTAVAVALVAGLAIASWETTRYQASGHIHAGTYRITIQDDSGKPVNGAELKIVMLRGKPVPSLLFSNYSGPNSITSDGEGRMELIVPPPSKGYGYGGWVLFWVIPFEGEPSLPERLQLCISAAGYQAETVSFRRLLEEPSLVVVLRSSTETRRGDR